MTTFSEQFPIVFQALNVGFLQTLKLFFVTLIGAIPLGLIISFGSMSRWSPLGFLRPLSEKSAPRTASSPGGRSTQLWFAVDFQPIRLIVRFVIWVVRGTPLMLQLLVFYYFPGLVLGKNIWGSGEAGRFLASSIAFIFNYACYFSEIFRGGIQGVPKGQQEAGQVLGMTNTQIFFKVTLLQMVKRIVPPMSNEIITLVKDTSLSRIIALQEIIWAGQAFLKGTQGISGAIWPLFFTGIYYLHVLRRSARCCSAGWRRSWTISRRKEAAVCQFWKSEISKKALTRIPSFCRALTFHWKRARPSPSSARPAAARRRCCAASIS